MRVDDLIGRLDRAHKRGPGRWLARCPAHADRSPSLSIRELDDGTILLHDFGGCDALSICRAIGIELADLFPDRQIRRIDRRARSWLSAAERLELIDHEVNVVGLLAADFLGDRSLSEEDWERLVLAVARIGGARHG